MAKLKLTNETKHKCFTSLGYPVINIELTDDAASGLFESAVDEWDMIFDIDNYEVKMKRIWIEKMFIALCKKSLYYTRAKDKKIPDEINLLRDANSEIDFLRTLLIDKKNRLIDNIIGSN